MKPNHSPRLGLPLGLLTGAVLSLLASGCATTPAGMTSAGAFMTMRHTNYHGWADSYVLNNGVVEAIVVPAIGRVMQFQFVGEEGVFWENRSLDGHLVDTDLAVWRTNAWVNFGGDKSWPSPEAEWSKFTGRNGWSPPPAFDGMPWQVHVEPDAFVLTSPVDPFYGVRVQRRISLKPRQPVLVISTNYKRVSAGEPAKMGVWVIAQLKNPVSLFSPVPKPSFFREGHTLLGRDTPPELVVRDGLVSLTRDPKSAHKIGLDSDSLLWVGDKQMLYLYSPRVPNAEYPDQGSNMEIYTNPDPLQYIELETLSPLHLLYPGEKIEHSNTYMLLRRTKPTAEQEARALFKR